VIARDALALLLAHFRGIEVEPDTSPIQELVKWWWEQRYDDACPSDLDARRS
jgi:hypothetical protein